MELECRTESARSPLISWSRITLSCIAILVCALVTLQFAPNLLLRWWKLEAQSEADAAYLRRQAELKAETEAADIRLARLDDRMPLVSLGFREVARKVAPTVVNLVNEVEGAELGKGRHYFDPLTQKTYREQGEGSGVIIQPGLIVTNHHVVRAAERLRITFANTRTIIVGAEAVSSDPLTDLALVKFQVPAGDFDISAQFADSDRDVHVGDWVLACGSPFGLQHTMTAGIVSAKGRVDIGVLDQVDLLQTDAAINPGNSGGPLFDQLGRVVGINVAIASRTGGNQGVGFAIPSNTVQEITGQLLEHGEVVRGFLGVVLQDIPIDMMKRLGVKKTGGAVVSSVGPNTPADHAGFQRGDIIIRFDGQEVGSANAVCLLRQRIARTKPDTEVTIDILRRKEPKQLSATIMKRPASP